MNRFKKPNAASRATHTPGMTKDGRSRPAEQYRASKSTPSQFVGGWPSWKAPLPGLARLQEKPERRPLPPSKR